MYSRVPWVFPLCSDSILFVSPSAQCRDLRLVSCLFFSVWIHVFLAVSSVIKLLLNSVQPESFIWTQSACSTQHHIMTEDCDIVKGKRKKNPSRFRHVNKGEVSEDTDAQDMWDLTLLQSFALFIGFPCTVTQALYLCHQVLPTHKTRALSSRERVMCLGPETSLCSISKDIIPSDSSVIVSASVYERCLTTHRHSKWIFSFNVSKSFVSELFD